ncbi:MAG TPA: pitrilysin family protein [Thermoanaerobaculia bacterium]|nr:pitrilysin family protein [Thermoanaerobaculia bacterium]
MTAVLTAPAQPAVPALLEPVLARTVRHRTARGLNVVLLVRPELPVAHLTVIAQAGALRDPVATPGLAAMVQGMLREGTPTRDRPAVEEALRRLGSDLELQLDWHAASISLGAAAGDAAAAAELLLDLVAAPAFPAAALDGCRRRLVSRDNGIRRGPWELASRCLDQALFGDGPYGRPLCGDAASLAELCREDLIRFHRGHYGSEGSLLLAVGRFQVGGTMERLEALAERLPTGEPEAAPATPVVPEVAPRVVLIDVPEARQTTLRLGQLGIARHDPDSDRLRLLAAILGGTTESRLNRRLREDLGYTYQAQCLLLPREPRSLFTIAAAVRSDRAGEALRLIDQEVRRLGREPVTPDELGRAQNRLAGIFLRSFQSHQETALQLRRWAVSGFRERHFESYLERLFDSDPGRLCDLAARQIRPGAFMTVAVGPAATLRPQLAGLGELTVARPQDWKQVGREAADEDLISRERR